MSGSSNKTVYFLGAGASRASDFKLPVMKEFFREEDIDSGEYQILKDFIHRKFPGVAYDQLNMEEVITFLDLSLDTFGRFGEHTPSNIYEARREFDDYVRIRLKIPKLKPCNKHLKIIDEIVAGQQGTDTIITLNYDLAVDNTLYDVSPKINVGVDRGCLLGRMYALLERTRLSGGDRPSLYPGVEKLGFYLKLHGSIDWLYCRNSNCGHHQVFFPNWLGVDSSHSNPGQLCKLCGSPLVCVIVPPTMHKTFNMFPKLGLLWSLAYRELKAADRIVFFGVSFAASDYYLRWLIKKSILDRADKPEIIDIDISDKPSKTIKEITGIEPVYVESIDNVGLKNVKD